MVFEMDVYVCLHKRFTHACTSVAVFALYLGTVPARSFCYTHQRNATTTVIAIAVNISDTRQEILDAFGIGYGNNPQMCITQTNTPVNCHAYMPHYQPPNVWSEEEEDLLYDVPSI